MALIERVLRTVELTWSLPHLAGRHLRSLEQRALTRLAARLDGIGGLRRLTPPAADAPSSGGLLDLAVTGATTALTPTDGSHFRRPKPSLRQRFESLLDASLKPRDDSTPDEHPAFSRILDQIVPDEALIISLLSKREHVILVEIQAGTLLGREGKTVVEHFSGLAETVGARHPEHVPAYIDNLCRLGLMRIARADPADRDIYELLEASPECEAIRKRISEQMNLTPKIKRKQARLTALGRRFCDACSG